MREYDDNTWGFAADNLANNSSNCMSFLLASIPDKSISSFPKSVERNDSLLKRRKIRNGRLTMVFHFLLKYSHYPKNNLHEELEQMYRLHKKSQPWNETWKDFMCNISMTAAVLY